MKKVLLMMVMLAATVSLQAQKFALVDMDYIFKNIPAYERANESWHRCQENGRQKSMPSTPRHRPCTRTTRTK